MNGVFEGYLGTVILVCRNCIRERGDDLFFHVFSLFEIRGHPRRVFWDFCVFKSREFLGSFS